MSLLREYAIHNSEAAFETLVSRHIGLVHSAALRQVRDPHLAEEVAQAVFIILVNKAVRISDETILCGWLYKTTRFVAVAQSRTTARRRRHEQEYHMQSETPPDAHHPLWEQISPLLDEALAHLGEKDRQAVLLRFFEDKSLAEVSNALGAGEDAVRMRINRALEKLHRYFTRHGISSTAAVIAGVISSNSVQAAPTLLAKSVATVALAQSETASGSTLTLIKGALKLMAWTKVKMAVVVSVGVLLAIGTATVTVRGIQEHQAGSSGWQVREITLDAGLLRKMRPLVQVVPTKFSRATSVKEGVGIRRMTGDKSAGLNQSLADILRWAYGGLTPERLLVKTQLPQGGYDFISTLPEDPNVALQQELKHQFGVVARHELIETNVLLLRVRERNAMGLRPASGKTESSPATQDRISLANSTMEPLAWYLETAYFKMPVIDQTGLTDRFDYEIKWEARDRRHPNLDGLKQALIDQLGLELVPGVEPVEMVVVEKAN